jgi:hypothetical protein
LAGIAGLEAQIMQTLLIRNNRTDLLKILPKESTIAEIGVARADFSAEVLHFVEPKKYYLIDPWEEQLATNYRTDASNMPQEAFDKTFLEVQAKMQEHIDTGVVELRRSYSTKCAAEFPHSFFDFVYIDGNHTYDAVMADLRAYYPRVKDSGFLAGHDLANHLLAAYANFGVIEAVRDFLKETDAQLIMITGGSNPTYVIAHPNSQATQHLTARALLELAPIAVFEDFPSLRFSTVSMGVDRLGNQILLPKLGPR